VTEQGASYATFIEAELRAERDRRTTLDAKGLGIVTTTAALTTVLTAVGAFVSTRSGFRLPHGIFWPLAGTLVAFVVAAVLGILAAGLHPYAVATPKTLEQMLRGHWQDHEVDARNNVSRMNMETIASLRRGNNRKGKFVSVATWFQIGGLVSLAVVVFLILWSIR